MAFTTTQRLDNALLRNLNFRTPLNVPISSQYTLYANGQGQTYWSNSVSPTDLSTVYSTLSTYVYALGSTTTSSVSGLTSSIAFVGADLTSFSTSMSTSIGQLLQNDSNLSNGLFALSNSLTSLAYSNFIQINTIYSSTIQEVSNILNNYSNLSTFYIETSNLLNIISESASSLSTAIYEQNASTYSSLTSNYEFYTDQRFILLDTYLSTSFQYVFDTYNTILSTQSSISGVTVEMLSSSSNIQSTMFGFSTVDGLVFSSIFNDYLYPISSIVSTHEVRITSLEVLSTNLSTVIQPWVTSTISTSQGLQNIDIQSSISSVSYLYESLTLSTINNMNTFNNFSSYTINMFTSNSTSIGRLNDQVSTLIREFSVLTTSSILAGIYDSFIDLEIYTSTIIVENDIAFKSTLIGESISTIESTANSYFNAFVETMYDSTLSTLIPSTQAYYSSITSTTLEVALSTSLSSMYGISEETTLAFLSTTDSITSSIISSSEYQLDSSIQAYLVLPTTSTNSAYSTTFYSTLSTMLSTGYGQINVQSTMFSSLFNLYSTSLSTIWISSMNQIAFMSTQTGFNNSNATAQLSTQSSLFVQQLSTQNGLFGSTIATFAPIFNSSLASTTNAVYIQTSYAATSTLTNIEISTVQMYNRFVIGLNNAFSTATYSSLYTEQTLNLTSNTSTAIMDLATYRNFNVNIYNIQNAGALYRLSYSQNTLLNMNYRSGFIFINVSTVGQSYTTNNGQLRFDAYQWGLPTTVFGSVYPYISNADYTLQYQYVIQNNVLYTNIMNVYPRIRVQTTSFSVVGTNPLTNDSLVPYSNAFWRGTAIQASWSRYCFFPSSLGAAPFDPQVVIDMVVGGNIVAEYGPYSFFNTSNAIVNVPYLTGIQSSNVLGTLMRVYIAGAPDQAATSSFFTVMPTFDRVRMIQPNAPATGYVGGTELVAVTDLGGYPLYSTTTTMNATSGRISYDNTLAFIPQNVNNGLLNQVGAAGYDTVSLAYSTTMNAIPFGSLNTEPEGITAPSTIRTGNVTQTSTTTSFSLSKTTTTNAWDATAYVTTEFGFTSNAFVAASPNVGRTMSFGLDTAPAGKTGTAFTYCWYFDFATVAIYTSGGLRVGGLPYLTTNRYAINFANNRVRFLINNVEQYSEARTAVEPLLLGTSFFSGTSQLNNIVYSPLISPVGFVKEATQEIGSTVFFVNFGPTGNSYFSRLATLRQYGVSTFFRFSRLSTSVQFQASSIQLSTGTTSIWRIDSGTASASNTFTMSTGTLYMNYSYTFPTRISTSAVYRESTFCAPSIVSPDPSVTVFMDSVNLSSNFIPVSTLLFYNLLGTPIAGTQTSNMIIRASMTSGLNNYVSSFVTNGTSNVQIFRI